MIGRISITLPALLMMCMAVCTNNGVGDAAAVDSVDTCGGQPWCSTTAAPVAGGSQPIDTDQGVGWTPSSLPQQTNAGICTDTIPLPGVGGKLQSTTGQLQSQAQPYQTVTVSGDVQLTHCQIIVHNLFIQPSTTPHLYWYGITDNSNVNNVGDGTNGLVRLSSRPVVATTTFTSTTAGNVPFSVQDITTTTGDVYPIDTGVDVGSIRHIVLYSDTTHTTLATTVGNNNGVNNGGNTGSGTTPYNGRDSADDHEYREYKSAGVSDKVGQWSYISGGALLFLLTTPAV